MRGIGRKRASAMLAAALIASCGGGDGTAGNTGTDTGTSDSQHSGGDDGATPGDDGSSNQTSSESGGENTSDTSGDGTTTEGATEGAFDLLTYNVAGLPEGISGSNPVANHPQISPLLNQYDIALVQEDFAYHDLLSQDAEHPHQSVPKEPGAFPDMGDGLNRFSVFPFGELLREAWEQCSGFVGAANDCLTSKGFSVAATELAPGVLVDIYNLHMDAGGGAEDVAARDAQTQQMLATIESRSAGMAIIVAGDTNMGSDDEASLQMLLQGAQLEDACRVLACGENSRIDRIMFRSSDQIELSAESWRVDTSFVDGDGNDLSDHEAVGVDFSWALR
jgi:endonuclease/exonuclease/phosphatase family metal-dependent hydrolase